MGAKLCILWQSTSDQNPESPSARDFSARGSWFKEFITPRCLKIEKRRRFRGKATKNFKRKAEMKAPPEKKINNPKARKLTLKDWLLASPGLTPECLKRGTETCVLKQVNSNKKVHPFSIHLRGSSKVEIRDSLSLDRVRLRPMNRDDEEGEGIMSSCSSSIAGSLSGTSTSQKRVSFKLPHNVIFYSPDDLYCNSKETSLCSPPEAEEAHSNSSEEDSPVEVEPGNSFDLPEAEEDPCFRLAVNTLPHIFISSSVLGIQG